jgi:hypothetical protein
VSYSDGMRTSSSSIRTILVYADELAREWREMLTGQGYAAIVLSPGQPTPGAVPADICLVAVSDPVAERFWMSNLTMPTLLVTRALGPAQALCERVPWLRLICHPTRAVQALEDMLQMTRAICAGALVLGPFHEAAQAEQGWGGSYAN